MRIASLLIFLSGFTLFSQELYPINRDGKWGLMDSNGEAKLAPQYDYIEFQWAGNKFVFDYRGKFGIMDHEGAILKEPTYQRVKYFSPEISGRKLDGKWNLYMENEALVESVYDSINRVNPEIYCLYTKDKFQLYHIGIKKLNEELYTEREPTKGMLECNYESGYFDYVNTATLEIIVSECKKVFWHYKKDWGLLSYKDSMQLIEQETKELISDKYQKISIEIPGWFLCKNDTTTYMYHYKSRKTYPVYNFDELTDVSGSLCVYKRKGKFGVFNFKTGKPVMPPKYSGLALSNGKIYTWQGSKYGLSTKSGKEIFPPEYDNIIDYGNFYVVQKGGKFGISSKSGKEIEPVVYNKIAVFDNNVKCYQSKTLTTLNIDNSGNLKDRTVYDEFMRVNFTKTKRPLQNASFLTFTATNNPNYRSGGSGNGRANPYGWCQREMERTIKDSTFTIYGSWGIKDKEDSLRFPYQYADIDIISDTTTRGFRTRRIDRFGSEQSLKTAAKRKMYYKIGESIGFVDGQFQMVDHVNYYRISNTFFKDINWFDCQNYALAKALTKEPVLIDANCNVVYDDIKFWDNYYNDHMRVCFGGEYIFYKWRKDYWKYFSVARILRSFGLRYITVDEGKELCRIKGGRWHFIDKDGAIKNDEPFQFVQNFYQGRAIVARKNKWGVIDTGMNVIVPIEFDSVSRMYVDGKTYFHVWRKHKEKYLYNRAGSHYTPTSINPNNLNHYHNGKYIYNGTLVDTNLNDLGKAEYSSVLGGFGKYTVVSLGDEYGLIDENGKLTSKRFDAFNIRPIDHGRYLLKREGGNFAIIDANGDYLVPKYIGYKLLANTKDFVFYLDYNLKFNYWGTSEITFPKKVEVLSGNPEVGLLLVKKGDKKFLYNYNTQEILKKDVTWVRSLERGGMVYQDIYKYDRLGMVSYAGDTLFKGTYWNIDFEGKDWGLGKLNSDQYILIDTKGNPILKDTILSIVENGSRKEFYFVRTSKGKGMINKNAEIVLPFEYSSISMYERDIFRLTVAGNDTVTYMKDDGTILFTSTHETGIGFPPNGYIKSGPHKPRKKPKKYFYDGYLNRSMPFNDIHPVSNNTFILEESRQVGVYDFDGDTIVPIAYHKVIPVRGKFQVRFFNSFGYINQDKSANFDPRIIK